MEKKIASPKLETHTTHANRPQDIELANLIHSNLVWLLTPGKHNSETKLENDPT